MELWELTETREFGRGLLELEVDGNFRIGYPADSVNYYLQIVPTVQMSGAVGYAFKPSNTGVSSLGLFQGYNGFVGVGTSLPAYTLDVQGGQVNSSGGYCINGTNCITSWPAEGGGTVTSVTAGTGLTGGTFTTSGTVSLNLGNANTWTGAQTFNANSAFNSNTSFNANATFPAGIWNISGNVGIGTTKPGQQVKHSVPKLHNGPGRLQRLTNRRPPSNLWTQRQRN